MKKLIVGLFVAVLFQLGAGSDIIKIYAQSNSDTSKAAVPEAEKSVTRNTVTVDGEEIEYTATAGTMILKNDKGEPVASFGYTAYSKNGVEDKSTRPLTFSYNGGPGSSSIWLHMGVMGPRRVVVDDPNVTPPAPYELTDNQYSMLDATDIVMVDPVGTGVSRAIGKAENSDFWGIDEDIRSVGNFIKTYLTKNNRLNSPKYLLGESYGTTRSAGVANYLQNQGIAMNGVVMVSTVLDLRTIAFGDADSLPYVIYLPTYAAVAWYHDKIDNKPDSLKAFVEEARNFASGEYAAALMKGNELSESRRQEIINKLAEFTGLSMDYLDKANMRVTQSEFTKELLRDEGRTVGRLDSRYTGHSLDDLAQNAIYDPQSSAISPAYTTLFLKYFRNELNFDQDTQYNISAYSLPEFDWNWDRRGSYFPTSPTTAPDLAEVMTKNPNLEVLVLNGYYDLATPPMGAEYTIDHLNIPSELEDNITMKYYKAGHMMYIHEPSLEKFHDDVEQFIQQTDVIK